MANLSLEIRFDTERTLSFIGSAAWAVERGLLTDEEVVEVIVDEMLAGMKVIPVLEEGEA